MASIGEVKAVESDKQNSLEKENYPYIIYFGVFFDGTSNNMVQKEAAQNIKKKQLENIKRKGTKNSPKASFYYERELVEGIENSNYTCGANQTTNLADGKIGINKSDSKGYSNIGILHSLYRGLLPTEYPEGYKVKIFNIYVEGSGSNVIMGDEFYERNANGVAFGKGKTGVAYLVSKALELSLFRIRTLLYSIPYELRSKTKVKFDVFGFSRGAACARMFSYCIAKGDNPIGKDELPCIPELLDSYLSDYYIEDNNIHFFCKELETIKKNISVDFLGIYDTVASIGGVRLKSYCNNTRDYGLYSPSLNKVNKTFHICAMDEFRSHFGLTDIGEEITKSNGEIFLPGCHSDIGGGFVNGDESFKVPYAFTIKSVLGKGKVKYFKITKSRFDQHTTTDFIRYLRNYGFLGIVEDNDISPENDSFWGTVNDCTMTKSFGMVNDDVMVTRKSIAGYSNIPLSIMIKRAIDDTKRSLFRNHEPIFSIATDILDIFGGKDIINKLSNIRNSRLFYYPGGSWDSKEYIALRRYLHFSARWFTGNDMYYEGGIVRRILYHGDKNVSSISYYSDYK